MARLDIFKVRKERKCSSCKLCGSGSSASLKVGRISGGALPRHNCLRLLYSVSMINIDGRNSSRSVHLFQRSFSFKAPSSPATAAAQPTHRQITPYKKPKPACADRRSSRFWSETVGLDLRARFSAEEIKRQEVTS